jgi:hypothetical protein
MHEAIRGPERKPPLWKPYTCSDEEKRASVARLKEYLR